MEVEAPATTHFSGRVLVIMKPCVWTIAGSDNCAGAGIQADLQTFQALGVYGCTVITTITAQNTETVRYIEPVSATGIQAQIQTLSSEFYPRAIKIGMVGNADSITAIVDFLKNYSGFVIFDPILFSSSGKSFLSNDLLQQLITDLFPYVDLITPNLKEAEILTNCKLQNDDDIENAANALLGFGIKSILIKGGHAEGDYSQDFLQNAQEKCWISHQRLAYKNVHGTGCVLSSAIAACHALGYSLVDAAVIARMYVNQGIRLSQPYAQSQRSFAHGSWPNNSLDLPWITHTAEQGRKKMLFPPCVSRLGFYPIVDSYAWVQKLLPLGVKTLQLRIKNLQGKELENEIALSILLAEQYQAQLFINDHWQLAVKYNAYGLHLGQDDLHHADMEKIAQAGLRLGISTHSHAEVARAHAFNPSYIAFGPIYPTTSKIMPFAAQGTSTLSYWIKTLENYEVVAIGGINLENIFAILDVGINSVAVISAITKAEDYMTATTRFLHLLEKQTPSVI